MQRILTASLLILAIGICLYFGGAVMGIVAILSVCFAVHEEYRALAMAGHRPVSWPTWIGLVISIPLTFLVGTKVILPMVMTVCILTITCVMFRDEPKLEDAIMSVLPLIAVLLPGMIIVSVALVEPKPLQVTLYVLMIGIPVMCDTMAYLVGSFVRGPKLCTAVSPNKTIAGAIGGLVGAVIGAYVVCLITHLFCGAETLALLPKWWEYGMLGLAGGVFSQIGDLFASLVKRHCGIKDFSKLFPGHGGMLDRIDSILFMAIVIHCYRALA